MSKSSDNVKKWRKSVRAKLVKALGSRCVICEYSKCINALELHHIDPSIKEFTLGRIIANPTKLEHIIKEAKKCILLCANYHREFHAGQITTLPSPIYDFTSIETEIYINLTPCLICGKLKSPQHKTCSYKCAGRLQYRVDWKNIDLIKLLENNGYNFTKVGDILGVSGTAVNKQFKKLTNK